MPETPDAEKTLPAAKPEPNFFSRYRLIAELGRGGMSVVWRAEDTKLHREVALKFLPDLVVRDREAMAELAAETRRCLELTHPNIVRVYDLVEEGDRAAISMELVDGPSLAERKLAQPDRCFTVEEIAPWIEQLCAALEYAHHKAHIVHRDLKPLNLLVNQHGELKVVDFGISRSLIASTTRLTTASRASAFSRAYASPQHWVGEPPAVTDDIYSLGVTIYELLTSKPPIYGGDLATQVRDVVPPSMNARRAELGIKGRTSIPSRWEGTVAACLAKKPEGRPASASDVAIRLGLAMGKMVRSANDARRRTRLVLAGAALVAVGALLAFAVPWLTRTSPKDVFPTTKKSDESTQSPTTTPPPPAAAVLNPKETHSLDAGTPAAETGIVALRRGGAEFRLPRVAVKVDQRPAALNANGRLAELEAGDRVIEITHPDFEPWKQTVHVVDRQTTTVEVKLVPKAAILTLAVTGPATFTLSANGKTIPVRNHRANVPPNESLAIEIAAKGFKTERRTVKLPPRGTESLAVTLEKISFPELGQAWTVPDVGLTLMPIAPGSFTMGSEAGDPNERPVTEVKLTKAYWLGKTEVTQKEWTAVMGKNPSHVQGDDLPVENVSWLDAMEFCKKLTARERTAERLPAGYIYTLPSEAQWEYACRAGASGDAVAPVSEVAWHETNSEQTTHRVGTKPPNAWGLHDMFGNVWEWCADSYVEKLKGGTLTDPKPGTAGAFRARRGGAFVTNTRYLRPSYRGRLETENRAFNLGLRVALVAQ